MLQSQILEKDKTLRMVQCAFVDRQARKALLAENLDQVILADVEGDGHDLHLGYRHIVNAQLAQVGQSGQLRQCRRIWPTRLGF